jgi:hypothetical protein
LRLVDAERREAVFQFLVHVGGDRRSLSRIWRKRDPLPLGVVFAICIHKRARASSLRLLFEDI